jgi:hypothetical protein
MLISKTAVGSLLGFGVSYDFTLDSGITSQVMSIELFSKLQSGTYTDGELGVFLYDKTNAAFITLSMQNITATTSGSNRFYASFFPSTSTSYRLIFHNTIANTTTSWAVQVDRIIVAPQTIPNAAAVGAWTSYTPTYVGFGTVATTEAWYRRIGDSMEVRGRFTPGTTTAVTASLSLPAGLTIGSITTQSIVGEIVQNAQLTANNQYTVLGVSSGSTVTFGEQITNAGLSSVLGTLFASNQGTGFRFTVPIAQWTTNINLATDFTEYASNSSSTNADDTTSFVSGMAGAAGVIGVTSMTALRFKRVRFSRPIQQNDTLVIELYNPTNSTWTQSDLSIGGSVVSSHSMYVSSRGGMVIQAVNSTDVDVGFLPTADGAALWSAAAYTGVKWRVRKVSNGNMAEQPPVVRAEYTLDPGTIVSSPIKFSTKVEDTHSAYSTATGYFTAPVAGVYLINFAVANASGANQYATLGTFVKVIGTTSGANQTTAMSTTIRLKTGDTVAIQNQSGSTNTNGGAFIQITRIGS